MNALRRRWAQGTTLLLADGPGLGKSTAFIVFLQSLRCPCPPLNPFNRL